VISGRPASPADLICNCALLPDSIFPFGSFASFVFPIAARRAHTNTQSSSINQREIDRMAVARAWCVCECAGTYIHADTHTLHFAATENGPALRSGGVIKL
jgi:hypothetical protein